jgi:conjugative transfer region lipoprotein (TIGR03751 family)
MRIHLKIILAITLTSLLSACTSNVIPKSGPSMEQVYDSYSHERAHGYSTSSKRKILPQRLAGQSTFKGYVEPDSADTEFHKLPNPELTMYVFPHFAAADQVPIPGYPTKFSAYEHDHYVLQNEIN